jgi:hypothetical protein
MEVEHRGLQFGQLNGRDAHSPNITQVVVAALPFHSSHLGSHPIGRTNKGFPFAQGCCDLIKTKKRFFINLKESYLQAGSGILTVIIIESLTSLIGNMFTC